jgi:hypothetical protein
MGIVQIPVLCTIFFEFYIRWSFFFAAKVQIRIQNIFSLAEELWRFCLPVVSSQIRTTLARSRIRIRIKVKRSIRIHIKVMRILTLPYLSNHDPLTCHENDPEASPFNVTDPSGSGEHQMLWPEKILIRDKHLGSYFPELSNYFSG